MNEFDRYGHRVETFHTRDPFWTINDDGSSRSIEVFPGPLPRPVWWRRLWLRAKGWLPCL